MNLYGPYHLTPPTPSTPLPLPYFLQRLFDECDGDLLRAVTQDVLAEEQVGQQPPVVYLPQSKIE